MAINDILKISDTDTADTVSVMSVGSIVVPIDNADNPLVTPKVHSPLNIQRTYGYAIVVSMSPFILVSENTNARWETTLAEIPAVMAADGVTVITPAVPAAITKLKAVGPATDDAVAKAKTRIGG